MSQVKDEGPHRDARILTRAIETVLRRLSRLLIGRISLVKLQEMLRRVFVEEAIEKLGDSELSRTGALAELSVLTGLDIRTLKKMQTGIQARNEEIAGAGYLGELSPLFKVLDSWLNDSAFTEKHTREPLVLYLSGNEPSFDQLVRKALVSRGITTNQVLQRLRKSGLVTVNAENGTVKLQNKDNIFVASDVMDMLDMGLEAAGNLLATIEHNIANRQDSGNRFFQRGLWNYELPLYKKREIRADVHKFLVAIDKRGRDLMTSLAEPNSDDGHFTGGIGIFYFETERK